MIEQRLGFIGVGNMGTAILRGLVFTGSISRRNIITYDVSASRLAEVADALGVRRAASLAEAAEFSHALLLGVKPQSMEELLGQLKPFIDPSKLVISVAAAVSTSFIERALQPAARVVRVMPNTPALVQAGAAAVCRGSTATPDDEALVMEIFRTLGYIVSVPEEVMDVVTALSGSGPAYFFLAVEALTEAAVQKGLERDVAAALASQTLYGAGKILVETGASPAELRRNVASRGGTTEAALGALEQKGFSEALTAGLNAAVQKAQELAK